uniref:MAM domain-containing protein n=1 Tax=Octopus bimaculoides TaxID=37653 RepID=A0A0L8GPU6_OCTBM
MSILQVTKISCLLLIGILPYTYGSWECSFQHGKCSWSTGYEQCSWKWTSKQLDGAKGYMVSTGQNRCTSEMTWQAAMFGEDGKPFSFLYRINGNGKVKLTVICAEYGVLSDTYHTRWTCNASPAHGWTKAHINCNYRLDKIIINAEFLGKANVMIGKIWNGNLSTPVEPTNPFQHGKQILNGDDDDDDDNDDNDNVDVDNNNNGFDSNGNDNGNSNCDDDDDNDDDDDDDNDDDDDM